MQHFLHIIASMPNVIVTIVIPVSLSVINGPVECICWFSNGKQAVALRALVISFMEQTLSASCYISRV